MNPIMLQASIVTLVELTRQSDVIVKHTTAGSTRIKSLCRSVVYNADSRLAAIAGKREGMTEKETAAMKKARDRANKLAGTLAKKIKDGGIPDGAEGIIETSRVLIANTIELDKQRDRVDRDIGRIVERMPIASWVDGIKGLSHEQVGKILADLAAKKLDHSYATLSDYSGPAKVWKRLGIGMVDGEAQRRIKNSPGLALLHKFSPQRRARLYVIEDTVIRASIRGPKLIDPATGKPVLNEDGKAVRDTSKPSVPIAPLGEVYCRHYARLAERKEAGEKFWTGIDREAKRRMMKELLRQLWVEWRRSVDRDLDIEQRDPWKGVRMMQPAQPSA